MKKYPLFVAMMLSLFFLPQAFTQEGEKSIALLFLTLLQQGNYQQAYTMQDEKMQQLLPQNVLQKMWEDMQKDLGELHSFEVQAVTESDGYLVNTILCRFEKMILRAQIAIDAQNKIAGLYFLPFTSQEHVPPSYVNQSTFTEKDITFGLPGWELPGTITLPKGKGPFPAVLLIHGSGANDRDETIMGNKPFRDLAWGMATQGIAVFRYDKRTYVHGMKLLSSPEGASLTVEEEVIIDALEALRFLREQPEIDSNNTFLLGHSLGGYLAPEIAFRDGQLRGIILCAAPARPLHSLIPEQAAYLFSLDGHLDPNEEQKLQDIQKAVESLDQRALAANEIIPGFGGYASYFYSLMEIDPLEKARKLDIPILIIQGGRDYQVSEQRDFVLWEEALRLESRVSFRLYPSLNHLLFPGEGPSSPQEYENPNHVDETVIRDIVSWVKEHTRKQQPFLRHR